jgi:hypothetical protein
MGKSLLAGAMFGRDAARAAASKEPLNLVSEATGCLQPASSAKRPPLLNNQDEANATGPLESRK